MAALEPGRIRSVAVIGHSHDGKTMLCEAMLRAAGATPRMGYTDHGTSILDYEPEEHQRSMSISTAVAHCDWRGARINLLDAPGMQDFGGELAEALAAADGAILVVAAHGSVPVGAELAWEAARARGLPVLIVVNKMDRENAAFEATVDALREAFDRTPIAVTVPIGSAEHFAGWIDLVDDHAHGFGADGAVTDLPLPDAMREEVERAHTALVDAAAETDDALIEKYLGGTELTDEEVRGAMGVAAARGDLAPIVCAAASIEKGAALVLDAVVRYLPPPTSRLPTALDAKDNQLEVDCDPSGPLCARVMKTTIDPFGRLSYLKVVRGTLLGDSHLINSRTGQEERFAHLGRPMGKTIEPATEVGAGDIAVVTKLGHALTGDTLCARGAAVTLSPFPVPSPSYSAAITARSKGDEDRIMSALSRQAEEDVAFLVDRDEVTHEVLVHGLGDVHLEASLERIKRKYGVEAVLSPPRIAYRETVTSKARMQHRYKKQSGGAGMYGDCTIEIEPLPRGEGVQWEDKIFGGAIPQQFRPSVEKGVRQTVEQGAISGHPIVDVLVRLVDGSTHPVDGKDLAFQIAGSMAMREAVREANPVLLEPVVTVCVTVPEPVMGDVMGLINAHRGKVAGMNPLGDGRAEVTAKVPQAEMHAFPTELRAMTQGRGRYTMEPSHYEEVPAQVAQKLIASASKEHAPA